MQPPHPPPLTLPAAAAAAAPPFPLASPPFLLPDCPASPHIEKKQHLIRSSYSTSFKGTLNDVFLGGDNYTLLLMQKEPLARSTQDADTAALEMSSFLQGLSGATGGESRSAAGSSPSPLAGAPVVRVGEGGEGASKRGGGL